MLADVTERGVSEMYNDNVTWEGRRADTR